MSNRDDEVRDRIMRDEALDAPPEDEAKAALVRRFRLARKKLLVSMTIWVLLGIAIFMWGGYVLGHVSGTRAMLAALFVMLVGFETTVLIKLWYWTVDSKAAVVEQIQRLGLHMQGGEEPAAQGAAEAASAYDRISMKWLRRAATAVIVVPSLVFGALVLGPLFGPGGEGGVVYRSECHAVLDADGTARVTGRMAFTYYGVTPLSVVRVPTGANLQDAAWKDAAGRPLTSTQEQAADGWVSLVQLPEPVFREGSADLRVTWTIPQAAREEGGTWTFSGGAAWRKGLWPQLPLTLNAALGGVGGSSQSISTVTLPNGATVTSALPKTWMAWNDYSGHRTVMWRDLQGTQAAVEVRYTLPESRAIAAR